jgi:hypothetical protein
MPFKDAAARREYMTKYRAEYREGKRRAEAGGKAVSKRTLTARAMAVKRRKRLWEIQNHVWRMDQQRERRRAAKADAERSLLQSVTPRPQSTDKVSTNHKKRTQRKAA